MVALPSRTEIETYSILRVLGEGGFGVTYLAEDRRLALKFAIKEYFPQSWASRDSSDSVSITPNSASRDDYSWGLARFVEEARTLARFRHPAIVRVSRIIEANNTAYMVLDYEEGADFGTWLNELGRAPTQAELDAILAPLLDALALVHRNNILHRDIAPDNIYMRHDGSPVLLDFGSAREAMGHRTKTLSAIIKSGYSPQEQYTTAGRDQGPWTDIYALGATLYKAVTGAPPPEATQRAIDDEYVPARERARGDYRLSFLAAIDHALQRHHRMRPQSVAEWRRRLLPGSPGEPAGASDDARTPAHAPKPKAARRWRIAAALPLILLVVAAGAYFAAGDLLRRQGSDPAPPVQSDKRGDEEAWNRAWTRDTVAAYREYLATAPNGRYARHANDRIAVLQRPNEPEAPASPRPPPRPAPAPEPNHLSSFRDNAAWLAAERANTRTAYESYLASFPNGHHANKARARLGSPPPTGPAPADNDTTPSWRDNTAWLEAEREDTRGAYERYLRLYPNGRHVTEARRRLPTRCIDPDWTYRPDVGRCLGPCPPGMRYGGGRCHCPPGQVYDRAANGCR